MRRREKAHIHKHTHTHTQHKTEGKTKKMRKFPHMKIIIPFFAAESAYFTCLTRGMINGSEIIGFIGRRASIFSILIGSVF